MTQLITRKLIGRLSGSNFALFGSCTFVWVGVLLVSRWGQKSALMLRKPNVTPLVPGPQSHSVDMVHNQNHFDGGFFNAITSADL